MVDKSQRRHLALYLRDFIEGQISNDQFCLHRPRHSRDGALMAIWEFADGLSSDSSRVHLVGNARPARDRLEIASRCIVFLNSNCEYRWPERYSRRMHRLMVVPWSLCMIGSICLAVRVSFALALFLVALIVTLPLYLMKRTADNRIAKRFGQAGDVNVWPFMRRADYETALATLVQEPLDRQ